MFLVLRRPFKKAGFSPEIVSTASNLRNRLYAMVRTGKFDDNFIADVEKVNKEPWFKLTGLPYPVPPSISEGERRFLLFEPIPIWEKVRVPVLALWGEDDLSVPAAKARTLWHKLWHELRTEISRSRFFHMLIIL